jgi:sigma-70-like protein
MPNLMESVACCKECGRGGHEGVVRPADVDALFREHGADVLAYALRRTDAGTAEDVVAEVFLTAWRRADRVPESEPVLWLYAVARRVLANQGRTARRRQALLDVLGPHTRLHRARARLHGELNREIPEVSIP